MDNLLPLIIVIYLVCHSPAILMVIIGLIIKKKKPNAAKTLFIIAGIYFLIGAGVCGALLS